MRLLRLLPLLLTLLAPCVFAAGNYQVELILFRQAGTPILASQPVPDEWAGDAQLPASGSERGTALNAEAAKLVAANGYEVVLHQAWVQAAGPTPVKVALSSGQAQLGHSPAEGTLSLTFVDYLDVDADFWVIPGHAAFIIRMPEIIDFLPCTVSISCPKLIYFF